MKNLLEVSHISKDFIPPLSLSSLNYYFDRKRYATRALDDLSFSLPEGKILTVLGENGAGKTTLLKILATLILPDKGTVTIDGYDIGKQDEKIKGSIGLTMPSERSFYWRLTGRQNLEFFAAMYGLGAAKAATRINELLKLFSVTYENKRFDSYSTGMQQKFSIMRALLHDPKILLLDEPTKSLDFNTATSLRRFIKDTLVKEHGKTVLWTTHDMHEANDFADIIMILHKGRLFGYGSLDELRKNNDKASTAALGDIFLNMMKKA